MALLFRIICVIIIGIFGINTTFAQTEMTAPDKGKTQIQKAINSYILEIYKFQGSKILQDLDANLMKIVTTTEGRVDAYKNIQETLESRKEIIDSDTKMWRNTKIILLKYLDFMILEIEKRKSKLL